MVEAGGDRFIKVVCIIVSLVNDMSILTEHIYQKHYN